MAELCSAYMYQLGIIFICPSYCLLFKKYFPLNTKNYFKYLGIILYLTLTVAPNSDIFHWTPIIILNTWKWYYIWHWWWHLWVLIIFGNQKKSSCSICPYSSYSNSFHNIPCLPVFTLLIFTTPCVSLCSLFLQHPMFARVHLNYFKPIS